ncbi:hypothetical protein PACTADRAFT_49948 [Pachysolen tannophilus NRRL Y-2460]|uniref:Mif2/CENP-C cupin domain-containing protein n=1 Tax=Pachysolen tannophilus NRRL Y-2460 TaxID=669874 RepID=A0A1E4TTY8_PACTA|nr:hypothetical protein PACTADRAFT_49948 [Pachysolen tannophilus NRRL Y-2460]
MDYMNLGQVSRKTGLRAKQNTKKDVNGMEDIDDFFVEEDSSVDDDAEQERSSRNGKDRNLARKLSFKKSPEKNLNLTTSGSGSSPRKSPRKSLQRKQTESPLLPALDVNHRESNDIFEPASPIASDHYLRSLETLSPINSKTDKKSASMTKKIALGKNNKKRKIDISDNENNQSDEEADDESDFEDARQNLETEKLIAKKSKRQSNKNSPIKPKSNNSKAKTSTTKRTATTTTTRQRLPSEPITSDTEPIRRSSRTKIPALAWWRNEKVIYEARKENDTIVNQVKKIVHVPEPEKIVRNRSHTNRKTITSGAHTKKIDKSTTNGGSVEVEYESDPEVSGSEWYKDGSLKAEVFEGPGSDNKVERVIAWAPSKEDYAHPVKNEHDDFQLAVLFDQDKEFSAAGMLEIPFGGQKSMKNNDDTYFIFHVVKGLLEVTVSDNVFIVTRGCSFEIPMGNFYQFVNKGKSVVKLFFVQSKYVTIDPNEEWD